MNWHPKRAVKSGPLTPLEPNPRPLHPGVTIGHVHMKAADLNKIYDFYVGVLGFDVTFRMPEALFLSAGGYHHHLAFNTWQTEGASAAPANTTGLYHIALNYPTEQALGDALRRLVEAKYPLSGTSDHGTHVAIYLNDPEGNGLELAWDRPSEDWPLDDEGHLAFVSGRVDLLALLEKA